MRKGWTAVAALAALAVWAAVEGFVGAPVLIADTSDTPASSPYSIAFASFAPLNADVFLAAADGREAKPFLPSPAQDWNASFSPDGQWIVFTSMRNGSADVYRAHPDGSGWSG
jgi:TolB protein